MSEETSNDGILRPFMAHIRFKDFDVCWAGPSPFGNGFCFGSEDGRLLITDEAGKDLYHKKCNGSPSGEAINGLARIKQFLAVATRQELTFWEFSQNDIVKPAIFPHGAHAITATASGYFVAALGRAGFMSLRPDPDHHSELTVHSGTKSKVPPNFYQVACLSATSREGVLAFACRGGGVAMTALDWEADKHNLAIYFSEGMDVVDLCAIGTKDQPRAVAALGRDGSLLLFEDVLNGQFPVTIKYDIIEGTAYRLLSCRGHLFLLTSRAMYVLAKLAGRFVEGRPLSSFTTPILTIPMEAVDANLYLDKWLLAVLPDEVQKYDIAQIDESAPQYGPPDKYQEVWPRTLSPKWERSGVDQSTRREVAGVG